VTTVRTRILVSVLLMAGLGMLGAGAASYVIQSNRLDDRIQANLRQEVEEFRTLAREGVDPSTGERFTTVEDLLFTALQRNVADQNETFLALVDGRPEYLPRGDRPVRLEEEPAVLELLESLPPDSDVLVRDAETSAGTVRFAAIQVTIAGAPTVGTYVIARGVDLEAQELTDTIHTYAVVAGGSLVLIALVGWVVAGRLLRPLRLLRDAAQRISETDLTQRIPVSANDDVSDLARTFNAMLDRLESAFGTQRQFLDDAGHELRTPITILRGHLELVDPSDPHEVAETRALVLDELDRMSRLVEDLILLAKSRRPDFVADAPVHLGQLTYDVLDKARALGDRKWAADAHADVFILGDEQRLTQALLQLAHNAVKFTVDGDQVAVGSAVVDGSARLWVRDDGPGVAAEDRERIFQRFGRAETGRGIEGSGLGLAIVAAIAEGHGGHVELDDSNGKGARFTLVIPLQPRSALESGGLDDDKEGDVARDRTGEALGQRP
jgi:signal transduction histidine kinase